MGLFGKLFGGGEAQGEAVAVIRAALETIMTPQGAPLAASRALSEILVQDGAVTFSLTVPPAEADLWFPVRDAAEKAVRSVRGVKSATVVLAAEHAAGSAPKARPQSAPLAATPAAGARPAGPQALAGVAAVVAVASGKGGVGKSTTAANLAVAAAQMGLKVGLLDADIYGPSVPRLFGVSGPPEIVKGKKTVPPEAHGIKVMSMGLLVKEETPVAWRGPMVVSALSQMIGEIEWAPLDLLLIDMPPGTGDIQLSLAQRVALTGAVIVSTPQDLALIDARKGIGMFRQVAVPILGIVENMASFICPHCGGASHIFGHGGAHAEADRLGVPFLGEIPLAMAIRETSDSGTPIVLADPQGPQAAAYRAAARAMLDALAAEEKDGRRAPEIVFE